jgi:serine/threonine protein kinase
MPISDRVGQQLANYRLIRLLGQGGFADVYLGEHVYLNTQAAIKVLDMRLTQDDMGDFLKEARIIAHLKQPSIIQVLEFGVEDNVPFVVMDYAPNGTLRTRFPKGGRLSPEDIQPYVMQIASALQYAHDEKLIHRDIKPENMLLGVNDEVLLADFSIAIVAHSSRTQSIHGVAGTVASMAPEQLRGMPVKASDQYALAAVIYEWLSGNSLFQGSFVEVATQHTLTPPLREHAPTISPMVERAVLKALAKDPAERFASMQEFAEAFAQAVYGGQPYPSIQSGEGMPSYRTEPLASIQEVNVLSLQETTITTYRGHTAPVNAVSWSPGDRHEMTYYRSQIASASDDGTVQIWDAMHGRKVSTYRGHSCGVSAFAWSPDGQWLASAGMDGTVQVWVTDSMRKVSTYTRHSDKVTALAWSPDGKYIASGGANQAVEVWEPSTGSTICTYQNHQFTVSAVVWSPDGARIASASFDRTVQIWNATTGENAVTYPGHSSWVYAVAWAQSGQHIASASSDKTVQVWPAV